MISLSLRSTKKLELIDVTSLISTALKERFGKTSGVLLCFIPHTTAAITINEAFDEDVKLDVEDFLRKLVPTGPYRHMEGNSMGHIISSLVGVSVVVPFEDGALRLGRWQGIFFVEADGPRMRTINLIKL